MSRLSIAIFLLLAAAVSARAQVAQSSEPPVIVAQGDATIRQAPDVAWVQIGVEARGNKPEEARQRGSSRVKDYVARNQEEARR